MLDQHKKHGPRPKKIDAFHNVVLTVAALFDSYNRTVNAYEL